jgi:NADPH:quinone reductase-like Zn-dependent oxidoreductase
MPTPMPGEVLVEVGKDVDGFAENDEIFGSVAPGSGGYAE